MFPFDFFSEPRNAELATLLIASPLTEDEKRDWLVMLPLMDDDEKNALRKNLMEEVNDFNALEKQSLQALQQKAASLFPTS